MLAPRLRRPLSPRHALVLSSASLASVAALWCLLSYRRLVHPFFLPSPTAVVTTLYSLTANFLLLNYLGIRLLPVLLAFIASAALAIPLGIALSSTRPLAAIAEPIIGF